MLWAMRRGRSGGRERVSTAEQTATELPARRAGNIRQIAAGSVGNVLELYDFAVYGFLAPVIAANFFPAGGASGGVLAAFAVFAVGGLMRPVGGVLVGHIADRYGRKPALILTVCGMAVPTVLIGLLPTYAAIGVAAPILLVVLRLAQGLAVGGEFVGSMVYLVETAPERRRGLFGACAVAGAISGTLLGSTVAALLQVSFDAAEVAAWAWRLPFLSGALLAFAALLLRRTLVEPNRRVRAVVRLPVAEALRRHPREIVALSGLTVLNAAGLYLCFVFVATWLQRADGLAPAVALAINSFNMVLLIGLVLGFGVLSERIGRLRILTAASLAGVVLPLPLFLLMHDGGLAGAFLGQFGFAVIVGAFGALPALMAESVGGPVRVSAVAIPFNLGMGIVGGLAPLVATWLIAVTGEAVAPAYVVIAAALVSFVATRFLRETLGRPLPP
jgi:MHS family proline/betaine transporter-like MFS transporter